MKIFYTVIFLTNVKTEIISYSLEITYIMPE